MEFITVKQCSFLPVLPHWGMGETLGTKMEALFVPWKRSRFGLHRREGLCFGKAGTDEQEDMSLSIYYQAILSPWRKALEFFIYDDSHSGSISLSHLVTPTWKKTFIQWLICKGASEEKWCVGKDPPLLFLGVGACATQLFWCWGKLPQNPRNTDTNVSAMVHFLVMLIFPVGNLVHKNTRFPIPVLDPVLSVSHFWSCFLFLFFFNF